MPVVTSYTHNTFCIAGLCSGDAAACRRFYEDVLGWNGEEHHTPEGDHTTFKYQGAIVAGMYQMADARKAAGVRPHWNSYLNVANVDETASKAEALGAKILMQPVDSMGDRMANLQDPDGVKFSIFQSIKTPVEPMRLNDVGALCWNELYATNPDAEASFYSQLLDWNPQAFEGAPMPYTTFNFSNGESAQVGMLKLTEEMKSMEPQWLPYFMVEDVDQTISRATAAGGNAHGPMDIPNAGRIAIIADAEGAGFGIIKPVVNA